MRRSEKTRPQPRQPTEMTRDDIEITLHFLKQRFSEYSIEDIIFSLVHQLQTDRQYQREQGYVDDEQMDSQENASDFEYEDECDNEQDYQRPRRKYTKNISEPKQLRQAVSSIAYDHQERLKKFEQVKLIATCFCNTGQHFNLVQAFLPYLTPSQYISHLNHINSQTIKELQDFLRYQCNIQMEHISPQQKRGLVNRLKKARQWLGKKGIGLLGTYFKFIQRHFQHKDVQISYDQAIALYKTFLEIVKSPHIDIFQIQPTRQTERTPPPHIQVDARAVPLASYTKEQEKEIVNLYLAQKNVRRVSQQLKETRGHSQKWTSFSIQQLLKYIIKKSLKRVIQTRDCRIPNTTPANFNQTDTFVNKIFHDEELKNLKENLLRFYKVNRVRSHEVNNLIIMTNNAYLKMNQPLQRQQDEISIIPKVEFDESIHQAARPANNDVLLFQTQASKQEPKVEQTAQNGLNDEVETQDSQEIDVKEEVTYEQNLNQKYKEIIQIE